MQEVEEEIDKKESEILELKGFLASKDYQTIREMQGGEPMDRLTKEQCASARDKINLLEQEIFKLKELSEQEQLEPVRDGQI